MRRSVAVLVLAFVALLALLPATTVRAAGRGKVYVLHIDEQQTIDPGMAQIAHRAFAQAESDPDARAVAIVIDTPGGLVASAQDIKDSILRSRVKTVAFVQGNAWSAGALIATASEKLYMRPGSSIGAAEPRELGSNQTADYKTVSALRSDFGSTAEARGRDRKLAEAMVDKNAKVPGQAGELLCLTAKDAVDQHYADGLVDNVQQALAQAGVTDYTDLVDVQPTVSEQFGRFLTTPIVAILLLVVGVIAIGIEFIKPGLTVPGLIGITCLGLFFLGNMLVGTASWPELALALIGILLLIIEAFIPGFGVFGLGGVVAMTTSIFLSVRTPQLALTYLMWTSIAFTLALFAIIRAIGRRGLGKVLTLKHAAKGYVPERVDFSGLVGAQGKAVTTLRPAGSALFGNKKVDVVTEGEFLPAGTLVQVLSVDGTHVIVRRVSE